MDNLDYIDSYFTDEPDKDRTTAFEKRIESDPAFAEEVAFYLNARNAAGEFYQTERKTHLREIYQKSLSQGNLKPGGTPVVRRLIYYIAAAAVVTGIIFGINIFTKSASPQELAGRYEKDHLQSLGVTMSSKSDSMQTGLQLYNDGKFADALQQFEKIIQSDTSNFNAKKYAGLTSLRMKDYDKAMDYFKQLESYKGLYSNPALFYQALTLMERNQSGDAANAKQLLQQVVQNDQEGKETAQEWLRKW